MEGRTLYYLKHVCGLNRRNWLAENIWISFHSLMIISRRISCGWYYGADPMVYQRCVQQLAVSCHGLLWSANDNELLKLLSGCGARDQSFGCHFPSKGCAGSCHVWDPRGFTGLNMSYFMDLHGSSWIWMDRTASTVCSASFFGDELWPSWRSKVNRKGRSFEHLLVPGGHHKACFPVLASGRAQGCQVLKFRSNMIQPDPTSN